MHAANHPSSLVDEIARLYVSGLSQSAVAGKVRLAKREVDSVMRREGIARRDRSAARAMASSSEKHRCPRCGAGAEVRHGGRDYCAPCKAWMSDDVPVEAAA